MAGLLMKSSFVRNGILIVIVILCCVLWLILPLPRESEVPLLFTPDPFYHARRVLITLNNFPNLPVFDYYISYPTGNHCIWPPLFDFLAACISWVVFFGKPNIIQTEWMCATMPVFWGILVVLLVYLLGQRLFDTKIGLLAAFIATILPVTSFFTRFGYFDHHISETFGLILIVYFLVGNSSYNFLKYIKLGIAFGISLLLWQGSILFLGLTFLLLIFNKEFNGFISFFVAFLIILSFSINTNFVDSPFSYRGLSYLHLSLLLLAGLFLFTLALSRKSKYFAIISLMVLSVILFFLLKSQSFLNGVFFIFKNDPWLATILEFQPLIIQSGYLDNMAVKKTFGLSYYVWPLMLIIIFLENRKKGKILLYFTVFCMFAGIMSFIGRRYTIWFVPFFSILFSYTVIKIQRYFNKPLGFIVAIVVFFINFILMTPQIYGSRDKFPSKNEVDACRWINDSLPKTSYLFQPNKFPEYGIMCFWDSGHYIVYLAQRPVTSSNFGNDAPNFKKVNQFFLTTTEDSAIMILNELRAPYVYIHGSLRNIYLAAKYLKLDPAQFLNLFYTIDNLDKPITIMEPNLNGIATTSYRLAQYLGTGFYYNDKYYEPYRHFRLRYFSGNIRIFELVKGAVIKGRSKSNSPVKFSYEVQLPNIKFNYFDSLSTDNQGNFAIIVPYPTKDSIGYEFKINGKTEWTVFVSEDNIKNGDTLFVK